MREAAEITRESGFRSQERGSALEKLRVLEFEVG
jgi:hypothetical protein